MRRKIVAIILCIFMSISLMPMSVFAQEDEYNVCTHQYIEVPEKNATCTENGWEVYQKCLLCEKTIPEVVVEKEAYGHQYITGSGKCFWCEQSCKHTRTYYVSEKEATCEDEGWEEHKRCYTCNGNIPEDYKIYEPLGHNYVNGACIRCETNKCNHETVENNPGREATCTDEGYEAFVWCHLCYQYIPESYEWIKPLGHNYVDGVCTRCEEKQIEEARIGDNVYMSLEEAVEAAQDGDTIHLLSNVSLNDVLVIDKSITIDGETGEMEEFPPDYSIYGLGMNAIKIVGDVEVNLCNLTIKCIYSIATNIYEEELTLIPPMEAGTISIGDGNVELNIKEVLVFAGGGVSFQATSIGQHEKCIVVLPQKADTEKVMINITNSRLWSQGSTGTGVLTYKPVELNLNGKSEVYGSIFYATYLAEFKEGSSGSVVNVTDTTFAGKGGKEDGVFVFEEDEIIVNIKNTKCQINRGPLFKWSDENYTGSKIIVDSESIINNLYRADLVANYNEHNNSIMLYGPYMQDLRENRMLLPENMCTHIEKDKEVVIEGQAPACFSTGISAVVKCASCGIESGGETLPATGHQLVDRICTSCGYEAPEGLIGDVTGDGVLDTSDAQAIFNHFMGIVAISDDFVAVADINGDYAVDTTDAQAAFNIFMGNQ